MEKLDEAAGTNFMGTFVCSESGGTTGGLSYVELRIGHERIFWLAAMGRSDQMFKSMVVVLLLLAMNSAIAGDRPIRSCEKAPILSEIQKLLPDHVIGESADVEPKPVEKLPQFPRGIWMRSGSSLTCVVVVLDETGKPQDAMVSYPSRMGLTEQEKQVILSVQWTPAQVGGQARPSLVSMDFEIH